MSSKTELPLILLNGRDLPTNLGYYLSRLNDRIRSYNIGVRINVDLTASAERVCYMLTQVELDLFEENYFRYSCNSIEERIENIIHKLDVAYKTGGMLAWRIR